MYGFVPMTAPEQMRRMYEIRKFHENMMKQRAEQAPVINVAESFPIDVERSASEYVITADLPGVSREDIDVQLNDGRLSIAVDQSDVIAQMELSETEPEEESKDEEDEDEIIFETIHAERKALIATRVIRMKNAKTKGLSAVLKDGVLVVTVPRREPKTVEVEIG